MLWLLKKSLHLFFWLRGWKFVENSIKDVDKAVVIVAGHTSNWDFLNGVACLDIMNKPARFTIKKEWMFFPFNLFFGTLGAFPIDRSKKTSAVEQMVSYVNSRSQVILVVTPEGTRSRQDKWKTGFYHVAAAAKIPIGLGYIDYATKTCGVSQLIYPSGDYQKDLTNICRFYQKVHPKNPEKFALDSSVKL